MGFWGWILSGIWKGLRLRRACVFFVSLAIALIGPKVFKTAVIAVTIAWLISWSFKLKGAR